jgi:hypothetical protein
MKHLSFCSFLLLSLLFTTNVFASPLEGSKAKDFVLTDINGNSHHLYDLLAQGKHVVIDFSSTWSPSSWEYAKSETLSNINSLFGNSGIQKVIVLHIESDLKTTLSCIKGLESCSSSSMGDWTSLVNYPIIDLDAENINVLEDYSIDKYPTIVGITPEGFIKNLGQASQAKISTWLLGDIQYQASVEAIHSIDVLSSIKIDMAMSNNRLQNASFAIAFDTQSELTQVSFTDMCMALYDETVNSMNNIAVVHNNELEEVSLTYVELNFQKYSRY